MRNSLQNSEEILLGKIPAGGKMSEITGNISIPGFLTDCPKCSRNYFRTTGESDICRRCRDINLPIDEYWDMQKR